MFIEIGNLVIGIPMDVGPRILHLTRKEAMDLNVFGVVPDIAIDTGEGIWRIYGGHRLWTSPEVMPRTYSLDDKPVNVYVKGDEVVVEGNPEPQNCVHKVIRVRRGLDENSIEVVHEIKNICRWSIEFSCWALTVMRQRGFAIIPISSRCIDEKCLLPDRSIALWPYTKLSDKRLLIGEKYAFVKQDPEIDKPFKIGVNAHENWVGYWVDDFLFIKTFRKEGGVYPDFNSSIEVYTNSKILEVETLSPLRKTEPGNINTHIEMWRLVKVGHLEPVEDVVDSVVRKVLG